MSWKLNPPPLPPTVRLKTFIQGSDNITILALYYTLQLLKSKYRGHNVLYFSYVVLYLFLYLKKNPIFSILILL